MVQHKPGSTATEDGLRLEILYLESIIYVCSENKSADQLHGQWAADLRLCFHICKNQVFSYILILPTTKEAGQTNFPVSLHNIML